MRDPPARSILWWTNLLQKRDNLCVKNLAPAIATLAPHPPKLEFHRPAETVVQRETNRERQQPASPRPAMPPALDINSLTEQVMRQMDRKLQAHRERMWRK